MAESLNFKSEGNSYVCEINPSGTIAVQVVQKEKGAFGVYGSIDGLKPVLLYYRDKHESGGILFEADVPEGVTLRMVSWTEVESCKIAEM